MLPVYNLPKQEIVPFNLDILSDAEKQSLALVYMPWGSISRASIAIGIIKQCARRVGLEPDVHYLNMRFAEKVGFELYEKISSASAFFPEWFFSSALFGASGLRLMDNSWSGLLSTELGSQMAEKVKEVVGDKDICHKIVDEIIPKFIEESFSRVDWAKYRVVGFSNTFAQTLASLLLAKEIKNRHPETKIVFGGANVDSDMGFEIIKAFNWVDYVVHGEAEQSFPKLLQKIYRDHEIEKIPGISMRCGSEVIAGHLEPQTIKRLDESPTPDYTDYFKEVERTKLNSIMRIKLSFESSRGCWWGAKSHCTFCGLNANGMAFRKKSPEKVYEEIMEIAKKHRCLTLTAVDNIIDMGYFKDLLPKLIESDLDLNIFYEVKANLTREQVRKLAAAGIKSIQPGIESFNSELLNLMGKGVTAIQNIQLLKWCLEYGIDPQWNILYGFPGENSQHYKTLPQTFRLLYHLRPPVGISPVIFERFSPYHFAKEKYKLTLKPLSYYKFLYPESLIDYEKIAYYFEGEWEGRDGEPYEYMKPALNNYEEWLGYWKERQVFFYYEKGPGFLALYDNRPLKGGKELKIRRLNLNELQAKIYLFCDENRSFKSIQNMLSENYRIPPTEEQINLILRQFVESGLMFSDTDRYISLAVRKQTERGRYNEGLKDF
ncbi:MAG: RiPP maturation radical SAM C-methyltransferase [Blastocatellia bacterium]|nr:RiPP maturation radical SAM C-methyltransferase [Blastocatellia bacterium]